MSEDKKRLILVVDDTEAGRYTTAKMLRSEGFEVIEAATGREALEMALKLPDLIILDVQLPDKSGFEVCNELKSGEKTKYIPVVHLSASYVDAPSKAKGLNTGADGYLVHPVEAVELVATVNALLRREVERKKLYDQAVHDPLTGLHNRLYMEDTLKQYLHIHDRSEKNVVTGIMLDIDYFKKVNDTFGHATGDEVLRKVAFVLTQNLRVSDLAVRYGGEEFAVFLFGYTLKDGIAIAEKVRNAVSLMTFEDLKIKHKITISAGVASHRQNESVSDFIHRMDVALYKAKTTGRNKVCFEETS